eukprot:955805_1
MGRLGIKCDGVSDGETAVLKASSREYSFILMDIELPNMSGVQAAREIRVHDLREERTPAFVFAVTSHCTPGDLEKYAENGLNGCIEKGCLIAEAFMEAMASVHDDPSNFVFIDKDHASSVVQS